MLRILLAQMVFRSRSSEASHSAGLNITCPFAGLMSSPQLCSTSTISGELLIKVGLWGAFAWHLLLDLTILFPHTTESPVAIIIGLTGALLTVPAAWAAGRWLLDRPTPTQ